VEEYGNANSVLVAKPEGMRPRGRPRCGWEIDIEIYLKEIG
jgi:hypothetical protein